MNIPLLLALSNNPPCIPGCKVNAYIASNGEDIDRVALRQFLSRQRETDGIIAPRVTVDDPFRLIRVQYEVPL